MKHVPSFTLGKQPYVLSPNFLPPEFHSAEDARNSQPPPFNCHARNCEGLTIWSNLRSKNT